MALQWRSLAVVFAFLYAPFGIAQNPNPDPPYRTVQRSH